VSWVVLRQEFHRLGAEQRTIAGLTYRDETDPQPRFKGLLMAAGLYGGWLNHDHMIQMHFSIQSTIYHPTHRLHLSPVFSPRETFSAKLFF